MDFFDDRHGVVVGATLSEGGMILRTSDGGATWSESFISPEDPALVLHTVDGGAFFGSMGASRLNRPVTGMVRSSTSAGYLMVGEDGGIFAFGDVAFHGSLGDRPPPWSPSPRWP